MILLCKNISILMLFMLIDIASFAGDCRIRLYTTNPDTIIYGNLQVTKILEENEVGRYYSSMISANFKNKIDSENVSVISVKYDDVLLKYRAELGKTYYDTSGRQPQVGKIWEVIGNGVLPSFTYASSTEEPFYNGYTLLPQSAIAGVDLLIPLTGISHATNISVQLSDGVNVVNQDVYLSNTSLARGIFNPDVSSSVFSFSFNSASTSTLSPTDNGYLQIIVSYLSIIEVNGKKFAVTNMFLFRKNKFVIN